MARHGGEPEGANGIPRKHRTTRRVRHARRRILLPILTWFGAPIYWLISSTWRVKLTSEDPGAVDILTKQGALGVFWHGRSLPAVRSLRGFKAAVLVSPSKDGQLSMAILRGLRIPVVEGSSSRGGARAMKEMMNTLGSGTSIAITPDGPRGPMHSMTDGVPFLAHRTGYPILPLGIAVSRSWRMQSWDRFTVPKPFSLILVVVGAPIRIDPELDDQAVRACTPGVRESLIAVEQEAARLLGQGSKL